MNYIELIQGVKTMHLTNKKNDQNQNSTIDSNISFFSELPFFDIPFRMRVKMCWDTFLVEEGYLRGLIDSKADVDEICEKLDELFGIAFQKVYAEVGRNGEKYDLIFNLEGDWSRLFSLIYFKRMAPEKVYDHWNIIVGRQSNGNEINAFEIRIGENSVSTEDINIWTDWHDGYVDLEIFCENLIPLIDADKGQAYQLLYILLDQSVGELAEMKYISRIDFIESPRKEESLNLSGLLEDFLEHLKTSRDELLDVERYVELYSAYSMQPDEKSIDGLRKDVFSGSSCCIPIINDFYNGDTYIIDSLEEDGITSGYIFYPLDWATGSDRAVKILDFRDSLIEQIEQTCGKECFEFIGGSTGVNFGYIDFIAYDLKPVIDTMIELFKKSKVRWATYHSFRKDVDAVTIYQK